MASATDANGGRTRLGLTARIFAGAATLVAVVLAGTLLLTYLSARRSANEALDLALEQTRQLVSTLLDVHQQSLMASVAVYTQNPSFRALIATAKPGDVSDQAKEAAEQVQASWVQITDASGVRLARSDDPAAAHDTLGGPLIGGALEGRATSGFGVKGDSLFEAVAAPIMGTDRTKVVGALMAAWTIDSALATQIRSVTASDVIFYTLDAEGTSHIAVSTLGASAAIDTFVQGYAAQLSAPGDSVADAARRAPRAELDLAGIAYVGQGTPLRSAGRSVLGGVVALRSVETAMAGFRALRDRVLAASAAGLAAALLFSFVFARRITRPVLALVGATRRAAGGDYTAPIDVHADDEIGTLAEAFRGMLSDLREKQALVDEMSAARERGTAAHTLITVPPGAMRAPITATLVVGDQFAGRYEIRAVLGSGGMGVVYKAVDRELDETVAIKLLRPEQLSGDPSALERFKSEIRLARRISHRNVVRTHDLGEVDGVYYITMEFVEGTSVRDLIARRGRLPVAPTLTIGKQLCRALEVAHEEGVIHRDIKPPNLVVTPDGVLKVMDFGIARLAQRSGGMTQSGLVVGTPEYMAPEQLLGDDVDHRVDIFATGVVLYECLTGRRPWVAESAAALVGALITESPAPPRSLVSDIPASLSDLIVRTLAKDPAARPQSAAALLVELEVLD